MASSSSSGRTTQAQIYATLIDMSGKIAGIDQKMTDIDAKLDAVASRQTSTEIDLRGVQQDIRDIKNASASTDARLTTFSTKLDRVEQDISKIKTERLINGVRMSMIMGGATVAGGAFFFVLQKLFDIWIKKEFGG